MRPLSQIFRHPLFIVLVVASLSSCASRKDIVYLQDVGDYETLVDKSQYEMRFKVDDLVSIHISTLTPEASAPFNLYRGVPIGGVSAGGQGTSSGGGAVDYLIDKDGMIDFPVIGRLKIDGLTPDELRILLTNELKPYLKDPIINIGLSNFTVTILGEVESPGTYPVPVAGDQISILEALGLAGDMTNRGVRENVLVIRDFNGAKVYNRINLTTKEMINSPVYYLSQNDVVYVEPNKVGIRDTSIGQSTTLIFSIFSLALTTTLILTR